MFALLVNPNNGYTEPMTRDVEDAARAKGLHLTIVKASTESEIETAFANPDPPLGMAPGAGGLDRSVIGWIRRPDPPDGSWE